MVKIKKMIEIITPENVKLEYELAGLGSRFLAYLMDVFLQFIIIVGLYLTLVIIYGFDGIINLNNGGNGLSSLFVAIIILSVFLVKFGYSVFFEIILKGSSPGKKLVKLKVIKKTGESINILDSVIRNFLRIFDFLPSLFFVGSVSIICSENNQRLGDLAANTVVICLNSKEKLFTLNDILLQNRNEGSIENIYPVSKLEYDILREFIEKKDLVGVRRPYFAFNLNKYFSSKFNITNEYSNPYDLFEDILKMNIKE